MTIGDRLEALRSRFSDVRIAAFADLSTGMVLASSTAEKVSQERLDALCFSGMDSLNGRTACDLARVFAAPQPAPLRQAVTLEGAEIQVFVRSDEVVEDGLCLLCGPDAEIGDLIAGARQLLRSIEAEG